MTTVTAEQNNKTEPGTEIVVQEQPAELAVLGIDSLVKRVELVAEVARKVMKKGVHYGKIPGIAQDCLFQPGADKLMLAFQFEPVYTVIQARNELSPPIVDYTVRCVLRHIPTDKIVGEGLGSCSSLESKYRYRWERTNDIIPGNYWQIRDRSLIGGDAYKTVKDKKTGKWYIARRVENENPQDQANTILKMAVKRAKVAATLTATAASDMFTQDLEDREQDDMTPSPSSIDGSKGGGASVHTHSTPTPSNHTPPPDEPEQERGATLPGPDKSVLLSEDGSAGVPEKDRMDAASPKPPAEPDLSILPHVSTIENFYKIALPPGLSAEKIRQTLRRLIWDRVKALTGQDGKAAHTLLEDRFGIDPGKDHSHSDIYNLDKLIVVWSFVLQTSGNDAAEAEKALEATYGIKPGEMAGLKSQDRAVSQLYDAVMKAQEENK